MFLRVCAIVENSFSTPLLAAVINPAVIQVCRGADLGC